MIVVLTSACILIVNEMVEQYTLLLVGLGRVSIHSLADVVEALYDQDGACLRQINGELSMLVIERIQPHFPALLACSISDFTRFPNREISITK